MKRLVIILMLLASVAYGASDYLHVTVAGAGNNDGQTWANAFSLSDFITDVNDNSEAGDVYYIKSGTYTMAAGEPIYITTTDHDGTAQAPISLIGVLSTTTNEDGAIDGDDYAYGTDRPYFDCSTNTEEFRVSDYWIFSNLSFLTNSGSGIIGYVSQLFVNCKAYNNKNTANYPAFSLRGTGAGAFSCEAYSDSGISLDLSGASHTVANCYLHDSTQAIKVNSTNLIFIGNVVENCTTGLPLLNQSFANIQNNTFSGCTNAITGGVAYNTFVFNNIFDECANPAAWTTAVPHNRFDYNSWDGDASSNTNVTIGPHAIDTDITLNADFSVQASSDVLDAGMQQSADTGIAGADFKVNIGADQDDNAASSGGQHSTKQGGKQ